MQAALTLTTNLAQTCVQRLTLQLSLIHIQVLWRRVRGACMRVSGLELFLIALIHIKIGFSELGPGAMPQFRVMSVVSSSRQSSALINFKWRLMCRCGRIALLNTNQHARPG